LNSRSITRNTIFKSQIQSHIKNESTRIVLKMSIKYDSVYLGCRLRSPSLEILEIKFWFKTTYSKEQLLQTGGQEAVVSLYYFFILYPNQK